jgi:hypothetical protein
MTIFDFLLELERKKIAFTLDRIRDESVMVLVVVPGQRWEVEFFADGSIEVERFTSHGSIEGPEILETLGDLARD